MKQYTEQQIKEEIGEENWESFWEFMAGKMMGVENGEPVYCQHLLDEFKGRLSVK